MIRHLYLVDLDLSRFTGIYRVLPSFTALYSVSGWFIELIFLDLNRFPKVYVDFTPFLSSLR